MIILQSRKLIFIHVHKCAGTSIETSLARLIKWNDIILGGTEEGEALQPIYRQLFGLHQHSTAQEVVDAVGYEFWNACSTFATVRSPYERAASLYCYAAWLTEEGLVNVKESTQSRERKKDAASANLQPTPISQFAAVQAYMSAQKSVNPFSTFLRSKRLVDAELGYQPQYGRLIDRSDGRLLVKHVLKVELLSTSWTGFCEAVGLPRLPMVKANVTPARFRRQFSELISNRSDVELINDRFASDFAAFGYSRL
jgi:hypothetical protein